MITGRDITVQVEAARLLEGVGIRAGKGELVGLIGPNGAGKSTLLRTLAGLLRPTEGSVSLYESDLSRLTTAEIARTLAMVHQALPETLGFTAMEVVLMGRYPRLGRFQIESSRDRDVAAEAMRQTETEEFRDRPLPTLSGGERQRVMISRALAQEPAVLLLDEPTANLDIQHQLKVLDLVRGLVEQGLTAIAAIHDLQLAARYCQRLILLRKGRVIAEGPPESVLTASNIEAAFSVKAVVHRDTYTGALALSLLGPSKPAGKSTKENL